MFDTFVLKPGDQHHSHSHRHEVHEHRAPTDASVKLLTEMEQAALQRLLATVRVHDCPIDCVVHVMHDHMGCDIKVAATYRVNGTRHRVDHLFVTRGERADDARQRMISEVVDALAQDIARQLLAKPLSAALRPLAL